MTIVKQVQLCMWCICQCAHTHAGVHACVHAGAMGLLYISSTLFFETCSLTKPGTSYFTFAGCAPNSWGMPGSASLALELKAHMTMLNFHINIGDLNPGPYATTTRLWHTTPNHQQSAILVTKSYLASYRNNCAPPHTHNVLRMELWTLGLLSKQPII